MVEKVWNKGYSLWGVLLQCYHRIVAEFRQAAEGMLLEQYVEEGFHSTVDWCPACYRPAAPVVHFVRLQGLALHGSDFEFHKVWEIPIGQLQLVHVSISACPLLPPYPVSILVGT